MRVGDGDGLLEKAYAAIPPDTWKDVYSALFREVRPGAGAPTATFIERVLTLWDWRVEQLERLGPDAPPAEIDGLGWLASMQALPGDAALPRIRRTVALARGQFSMRDALWDRVAALAAGAPEESTAIAVDLIEGGLGMYHVYFPEEEVETVLATGIRHGGLTATLARRMIHRLGEHRALDLSRLL